jgi:hypothetical protein
MKYYWDGNDWVERKPATVVDSKFPFIQTDLPQYVSPLSGKVIDGRRERREEMKKYDVREVDPSERPDVGYNGEPKGQTQLRAEKKYLADRAANPYNLPAETLERLKRG